MVIGWGFNSKEGGDFNSDECGNLFILWIYGESTDIITDLNLCFRLFLGILEYIILFLLHRIIIIYHFSVFYA